MYTVYVLRSQKDAFLYTGFTSNLEKRLQSHNAGKVRSTKGRRPLLLVYYEVYEDKTTARKRELFLKCGQGRKFLKEILKSKDKKSFAH
ncbi:MAG: GIY-YIG nuclease family protein [Candidatus Thorarchaeota archaeon]